MKNLNKYLKQFPDLFLSRDLESVNSIDDFLNPPKKWINDPFLFHDMDKAVDKIINCPKNKPILVHGDCDADGVSACAVLHRYLTDIGYNVHSYIPNRSLEGHILSKKAIDFACSIGCSLIITCDLGMSSHLEIDYAKNKSINVIITDHHKAGSSVPSAYAVINPWLEENIKLPFKDYSGSGVAFKLCHAINSKLSLKEDLINNLMSCVTIGIISDKVNINNENRYISFYGYNQLKSGNNLGLSLLNNNISRNKAELNVNKLIQVINMATKLDDPSVSVKLLTTNNPIQANKYSNIILKTYNKNKTIFSNAIQSAIRQAHSQNYKKHKSIFIISDYDSAYNGAIASRLALNFKVPCVVVSRMNDDNFKGSCRSVPGLDLLPLLNLNGDIFTNSGGHPMAAGFIIKDKNVTQFEKVFFDFMIDKNINFKDEKNIIDAEIFLSDINSEMIDFLQKFKPYGRGNGIPRFITKNVTLVGKPGLFGADNNSIRFKVGQNKITLNAIGFNLINQFEKLLSKNKLDIEYSILMNNNKASLKVYGIS